MKHRGRMPRIPSLRSYVPKVSAGIGGFLGRSTHRRAILFAMSPAFHPSDDAEFDDDAQEDAFAGKGGARQPAGSDGLDDDVVEPATDEELAALLAEDEDDPDLEDEFPMGDGVADVTAQVYCPYCGEPVEIGLDPGSGTQQHYVEDCQVCCQPWRVSVYYDEDGHADVQVTPEDER